MGKRIYRLTLAAILASSVLSCRMEDGLISESMEINLSAGIPYSRVSSKAGGPYETDYPYTLDINMVRWEANSTITGIPPLNATLGTPDAGNGYLRSIDFNSKQYFTDRTSETGFIGWHPSDMDYTTSSRQLRFTAKNGDTDVMISNFVKGNYETGIPAVEFSHVLCQYSVAIYAVDETARQQWEERFGKITGITISGFPGTLVATLPETPDGTTTVEYEGTAPQTYTITDSNTEMPVGIGNKKTVGKIIMAAPAIDEIVTITVKFSGGEQKQIAMSREFLAGYKYSFSLRFSHNGLIEPESSIDEWVETDTDFNIDQGKTYYNLSQYGTANCYIVSSANASYCFDCMVKGNGVNSVTDYNGNTFALPDNDVNIVPDSIGIIRSSAVMKKQNGSFVLIPDNPDSDYNERTDTEILTLDTDAPREGRVLFTVKGNTGDASDHALIYKGNVLIGAFSGETLLWSWHIWITDRPDTQGYGNGFSSLDRNLGAVTDNPSEVSDDALSTGFYYQWGRKDPLSRYDIDPDRNTDSYSGFQSANTVSMTTAHRNPRVMYYSSEDGKDDWLSTPNNYLWGYTNQRDDVQKTMYDPCPPGYRVPETKVWTISGQYTLVEDENGEGYKFEMDGNQTIYYPKTNYLGYNAGEGHVTLLTDQVDGTGKPYIYLNSARPHICSDFTGEDGTEAGHESLAHHFVYTQGSSDIVPYERDKAGARANAMPIRCISTNSTPATTDLSSIQTANSYIVSRDGYYKFLATMRGNGVSSFNTYDQSSNTTSFVDISAGLTPEISTNSGCRVDLLWWQGELRRDGDFLNFVNGNPSSGEIERNVPIAMDDGGRLDSEGYVYFYVKDVNSYGNVGLALYDEQGTILWTWHIWILPNEVNVSIGDYIVMSRNLGATYTPYNDAGTFSLDSDRIEETYGLYYQWGRKDPLFGRGKWCKKTAKGWDVVDWTSRPDYAYATTVAASVSDPLVFYTSNNNFWQTTYTPGTQGSYEIRHFWGFVGVRGQQGDNFVKTMYDPCPPGYRVMNQASFTSANICDGDDRYANETLRFSRYSASQYGIRIDTPQDVVSTYTNNGNSDVTARMLWLPNNRFINDSGRYDGNSSGGSLNTATPNNEGRQKRYFYWSFDGNDTYTVGQNDSEGHKAALPVRCQRE